MGKLQVAFHDSGTYADVGLVRMLNAGLSLTEQDVDPGSWIALVPLTSMFKVGTI